MATRANLPLRSALFASAVALLPLALFLVHAAPLRTWSVDDAGISYAYARNLAAGHGLVSQPGAAPVEGISNPLWTLLLAACFRLGLFDVIWTPKLLSGALVVATFALVSADLRLARPDTLWPALLAPLLLATSTSFVVWSTSGLENPLLALLGALSCVLAGRAVPGRPRLDAAAGAVAALLALTRPDALLYAAALPAVLLLSAETRRAGLRPFGRRLGAHAAGFVPIYGGYLVFRRAYFGEWLPNTYYAKEKPALTFLLDQYKWRELFEAALGALGLASVALLLGAALWLSLRARLDGRAAALAVHLGLAGGGYMLMPLDWMGEYRFATLFFVFLYWALAETLGGLWATGARPRRVAAVAVGLGAIAASASIHTRRTSDFTNWPIVPFSEVAAFDGHGFNRLADELPAGAGSLLTPDVGGAFFYSRLRVYDLVGLCDRTVARTLTTDTVAFHRYVFEALRPTFIHVHGPWAEWAAFHTNPRFAQEYAPIREVWVAPAAGQVPPSEPRWGDYVRRAALGSDPGALLLRLRSAYIAAGMERDNI